MLRLSGLVNFILFILVLTYYQYQINFSEPEKSVSSYLQTQLEEDSLAIIKINLKSQDYSAFKPLESSPFSIKLYLMDSLIWWNDKSIKPFQVYNGSFLKTTNIDSFKVESKIQLFDKKGILNPEVAHKSGIHTSLMLKGNSEKYIYVSDKKFPVQTDLKHSALFSLTTVLLLLILLSFLINLSALSELKKALSVSIGNGSIILYIAVIFISRFIFLIPWIKKLFDPLQLTEKWTSTIPLNHSLLDFTLNLILLIFLVSLTDISEIRKKIVSVQPAILSLIIGFVTFAAFAIFSVTAKSFVENSALNLETEYILQFNQLSFLLMILFIIALFLIFHLTQNLFEILRGVNQRSNTKYALILTGQAAGFFLLFLMNQNFPIWILWFFVVAFSLIIDAYTESKERKITYLLWWLVLFAGFLTINLFYFGIRKDVAERKSFIEQYYTFADPEILKSISLLRDSILASDALQKFATLSYPAKLDESEITGFILRHFKDSLNFTESNKTVELFDNIGSSLFVNHFANYHKSVQSIRNGQKISDYIVYNPFEQKYIINFEIENENHPNGPLLLVINIVNEDTERKAFLENGFDKYNFVVIQNNEILEKNLINMSAPELSELNAMTEDRISADYSYVISLPDTNLKIISFKKISGLIKPISMFSFILTLSGFLIIILTILNTRYNFLPENLALKFGIKSSLKTKIQSAIILLILSSFLIIGLITAFYFKNLIEVNQSSNKKEETGSIIKNIQSSIQNLADEESALRYLQSKLKEIAFIHNKELSLFNKQGRLVSTSARSDYEKRMPYNTWLYYQSDKAVNTALFSSDPHFEYEPLFFNNPVPFAYTGIQFKSVNNSTNSILDFLSTILNVYIFLFLLAGAIAITISNSITQPLSILAEKLKQFKLGKTHDPLEWKSTDEIGDLINDYNNLSVELHKSAEIIAKTERDLAWREMAKQVAHEIKNPLTPMKLSIQYLEKANTESPERASELIPRISATLVEQIDNLSQIANEFSNFATMPQASNEKIILNEIVETIHDLFRKRDDMDISLVEPIDELVVFADKNHLVRILNNLVKNAIQAIPEDRRGKIEIELTQKEQNALIRVSDNGTGIAEDMKDKVFAPNFTTKSSGTGLGLAISANMIDSFNGKIYFETQYGKGTDFYIAIPLMRHDDRYKDANRVSLD